MLFSYTLFFLFLPIFLFIELFVSYTQIIFLINVILFQLLLSFSPYEAQIHLRELEKASQDNIIPYLLFRISTKINLSISSYKIKVKQLNSITSRFPNKSHQIANISVSKIIAPRSLKNLEQSVISLTTICIYDTVDYRKRLFVALNYDRALMISLYVTHSHFAVFNVAS